MDHDERERLLDLPLIRRDAIPIAPHSGQHNAHLFMRDSRISGDVTYPIRIDTFVCSQNGEIIEFGYRHLGIHYFVKFSRRDPDNSGLVSYRGNVFKLVNSSSHFVAICWCDSFQLGNEVYLTGHWYEGEIYCHWLLELYGTE